MSYRDFVKAIDIRQRRNKQSNDTQGLIVSISGQQALVDLGGPNGMQRATIPHSVAASVGQTAVLDRAPRTKDWVVTSAFGRPPTEEEIVLTYPQRASMWMDEMTKLAGSWTPTVLLSTSVSYGFYFGQESAAAANDGDSFTLSFFLAEGTYTLSILGRTVSSFGRFDWYIDDVVVISLQDWYTAGAVENVVKTASVSVVGNGYHVLKGVINGKNASSTDFRFHLTKAWFKPTSD